MKQDLLFRLRADCIGNGLQESDAELEIRLEMVTFRPFVPGFEE
jgi:hypothetical protein